jgi:SH3 domain protein
MPTAAILPAARDRRHLRLPIVLALLCTLLPIVPAAAQTRYVTDQLEITLRAGAGNGYRIVAMLPSGERLQVLEQNEEWTRVRTGEGRQGWVLSRYLSQTPAARATRDQLSELASERHELLHEHRPRREPPRTDRNRCRENTI